MKKTLLLFVLLLTQISYSQIVTIPDANFKAALIAANIDTNNDGEIQVSEAEAVALINVNDWNISSLEGVSGFTNLTTLYCVRNNLTSLDVSSLSNLNALYCGTNQLSTLNVSGLSNLSILDISDNSISTFDTSSLSNLNKLNWSSNQLTSIDVSNLPALNELNCSDNQLTSIDVSSLSYLNVLDCSKNQLTTIDNSSISNVQKLYCGENLFTSLDASELPNLNILDCPNGNLTTINLSNSINLSTVILKANQLSTLDVTTLTNLTSLWANNNNLTSLDLTNVNQLLYLAIDQNNITSIDVSSLSSLLYLSCSINSLTELDITNLNDLRTLYCNNNQLTTLNVINKTDLRELWCYNNQLTSLSLTGSDRIEQLRVSSNRLTSLDVSGQPRLANLSCSNNQLITLNMKNGASRVPNLFHIGNNPPLEFICTDPDVVGNVQNIVNNIGYTNCVVSPFCTFEPGGDVYYITGNVKVDIDQDGCDSDDIRIPFLQLKVEDTNGDIGIYSTDINGAYDIPLPEGSYTIDYQFPYMSYFDITPTSFSVSFPADASPVTQDICLTPNGTYNDLQVVIIPLELARPGFDARYKIVYANVGTTPLSGNVQFTFQENVLDYVSSSVSPDTQNSGELNWSFSNLVPLELKSIEVTMNLNTPTETPPLNGGEILCYEAAITPTINDQRANDNTFSLKQTVVNSYDPNDKTCLEGNTVTPDLIGEYVHYLIRFENTGTASAVNVVVKDVIDTSKFDISTIVIYDTSHNMVTRIQNTNEVEFIFEGINLPFDDANNDGYIAFKIKTLPSLVVGDVFENSAEIYFDFNFPIITNTEQTSIDATASINDFSLNANITIFPNPTKDLIQIKSALVFDSVIIYDLKGRQLHTITSTTPQLTKELDVSNLASGIYYLSIQSGKSRKLLKFIRE